MKRLTGLLVVMLAAAAAWFYIAPRLAAKQLRDAAAAGDVTTLNRIIDFPRVRANMKADLRARLKDRPYGFAVAAAGGGTVDALVDRVMTPRGLVNLARLGPAAAAIGMGYRDVTSFFVTTRNPRQTADSVTYVFAPAGLSWRLERIEVPDLVALARALR